MFKVNEFYFEYGKNDNNFHLKCPNITFEKGKIYLIKGTNGSGKSTLLNLFSGYFNNGNYFEINGISSLNKEKYREQLGYVPDTDLFPDDFFGNELVDLSASLFGLTKQVKNQNLQLFLELFPIANNLLKSKVSTYSLGQRKIMSFIFRLIHLPNLIICDEPFIGLDSTNFQHTKNLLTSFVKEKKCVLFSSNNKDTQDLGDKILIIENGVVKQI